MPENSDRLTHLDDAGRAHIVDVSEKAVTAREASSLAILLDAVLDASESVAQVRKRAGSKRASAARRALARVDEG